MAEPTTGRTTLAHAIELLDRAAASVAEARRVVGDHKEIKRRRRRAELWRELAGAVAAVEAVRIWLDAGAPR